jgi:hypothetical protein
MDLANCEMTVSFFNGMIPWYQEKKVMPKNIRERRTIMIKRVLEAFLLSGGLNTGTPLLIASTPVMAVQPEEKARRRRKRLSSLCIGISVGEIWVKVPFRK